MDFVEDARSVIDDLATIGITHGGCRKRVVFTECHAERWRV